MSTVKHSSKSASFDSPRFSNTVDEQDAARRPQPMLDLEGMDSSLIQVQVPGEEAAFDLRGGGVEEESKHADAVHDAPVSAQH